MVYSWKAIFRRTIVLLVMLGCVLSILRQANERITEYNQNELQRNIQSVLDQNVETMTLLIDKHKTLVEATANRISYFYTSPEEVKAFILRQASAKDIYKFYRIGFIYPNGSALSSDGYAGNLAFREYFQRSMQGEVFITPLLNSALDKQHPPVNIISAPVKNSQGQIVGVVFETIPNSIIVDSMSRGVFAEFGSNALIDNNGEMIAANSSSLLRDKYNDLLAFATMESSQKRFSVWQQRIANSSNTTTMFFEREGGQYLHFAPIYLDRVKQPIHMAVLLSKETIVAQTSHFTQQIYSILGMLLLIAAIGLLYYFVDISKQEAKRRKELEKIAYRSPITKGSNFALLKKELLKSGRSGYIGYMEMREFEIIRSTLGAEKAEELLQKIWHITQEELGPNDLGGHIAADYFALFFNTSDVTVIKNILKTINNRLSFLADSEDVPPLVPFFGLSAYNKNDDIDVALSKASIARQSITPQRNTLYAFYGTEYTEAYLETTELEKSFAKDIEEKHYEVWFQPKFDCFTDEIIGAEALIRLRAAQGNLIPPYKFIKVFEQDGLIRHLDEYVFRTVCQIQKQRLASKKKVVPISINLSRASLYYRNIVETYYAITQEIGISPELVPLEITESAAIDVKDIKRITREFCKYGFKLHMDDFGSGYSCLASLNELPFENLKIDKSIIDFIGSEHGNALVKHTILLAKDLGMAVTAEGVETVEQISYLKTLNCHCIQGYYYSQPVEYKELNQQLHIF